METLKMSISGFIGIDVTGLKVKPSEIGCKRNTIIQGLLSAADNNYGVEFKWIF